MPSLVLSAIVGRSNLKEVFASEKCRTTAWLLTKNVAPAHVFEDAGATYSATRGFCLLHHKACKVPEQSPELFLCGFVCKANSSINPARASVDPVETIHYEAFVHAKGYIEARRPAVFLLENVEGLKRPRAGKAGTMLEHILRLGRISHCSGCFSIFSTHNLHRSEPVSHMHDSSCLYPLITHRFTASIFTSPRRSSLLYHEPY